MTVFVLDNSVTMRWLLATEKRADQVYSESVLSSLAQAQALVPDLWHLEVCNVSLGAYDAAYLELAIREHAPLATLDKSLRKAATRAGVPLYLR